MPFKHLNLHALLLPATAVYQGISQGLISVFIGNTINNAAYRYAQVELRDTKKLTNNQTQFISQCIGDLVSAPFRLPFEVRRIMLQLSQHSVPFNNYMRAVKKSIVCFFFAVVVVVVVLLLLTVVIGVLFADE